MPPPGSRRMTGPSVDTAKSATSTPPARISSRVWRGSDPVRGRWKAPGWAWRSTVGSEAMAAAPWRSASASRRSDPSRVGPAQAAATMPRLPARKARRLAASLGGQHSSSARMAGGRSRASVGSVTLIRRKKDLARRSGRAIIPHAVYLTPLARSAHLEKFRRSVPRVRRGGVTFYLADLAVPLRARRARRPEGLPGRRSRLYYRYEDSGLSSGRRVPSGGAARAPGAEVAKPALRRGARRVPRAACAGRGHRGHESCHRPGERAHG